MVSRASPERTCVGCRRRAPASELLRVVAVVHAEPPSQEKPPTGSSGEAVFSVIPDPARRRPGRGAHLHPDLGCLALAERRRAFGRALRVTGVLDAGPLAQFVGGAVNVPPQPPGTADGGPTVHPDSKVGRPT
ncbi:MAG: YlxR family protein [Micromonosporaceae bacterium]